MSRFSQPEQTLFDEESVLWRSAGDIRIHLFLGRAFLLQIAHPTISAGVTEHSTFAQDPFGRLNGSLGLVLRTIFAADGPDVGRRVRESHQGIRGRRADGERYSAYEPEAYFWVLATGNEGSNSVEGFSYHRPTEAERRRGYDETRELGRRFGLYDRDMPATLEEFRDWYQYVLEERLVRTPVMQTFLDLIAAPPPPPGVPSLPWLPVKVFGGRAVANVAVGTLPKWLRRKLDLPWSLQQSLELEALKVAVRQIDLLPERLRLLPIAQDAYARARAQRRVLEASPSGRPPLSAAA